MLNDEYWRINEKLQFFQIEEGVYVNVNESASDVPVKPIPEMGNMDLYYPLSWIVFTEIYNSTEE